MLDAVEVVSEQGRLQSLPLLEARATYPPQRKSGSLHLDSGLPWWTAQRSDGVSVLGTGSLLLLPRNPISFCESLVEGCIQQPKFHPNRQLCDCVILNVQPSPTSTVTSSTTNICAPKCRPPDHWALRMLTDNNKLPLQPLTLGSISCAAIDKWSRRQTNCPRNHQWWLQVGDFKKRIKRKPEMMRWAEDKLAVLLL